MLSAVEGAKSAIQNCRYMLCNSLVENFMTDTIARSKTSDKSEITKIPSEMFWLMLSSYTVGMMRLARARTAFIATQIAFHEQRLGSKIAESDIEAFEYVHQISHLVHANSLFDTFLSDCTRLLLSMHPGAIGANQQVSLQVILKAGTRSDILNQAIAKKTREIGMQSTVVRLESYVRALELNGRRIVKLE